MPQRVAITGASGLIGGALSAFLTARGDEVLHLVRRQPRTVAEIGWDPQAGELDPSRLDGVDAVVHLAGAGVGDHRWTPAYKQVILASRVDGTRTLATTLAGMQRPPALVCGSAVGAYGEDRGDEILTEESPPGPGFLAEVVRVWEEAARPARDAGIRVVHARTGLVLAPDGGAMGRLLPLARLGLGGPLGSGRQYWSWITLRDEVRALAHLVDRDDVSGIVNLTGPAPARQRDVVDAVAAALHRPALLPAPALALRLYLGEFSSDVLGSLRVLPTVLAASGFEFEHADLQQAAAWLVSPAART